MKATIIERNWVVEWFDERQCYHMPSLTMADNEIGRASCRERV